MSLPVAEMEYREHLNEAFGLPVNPNLHLVQNETLPEPSALTDLQRQLVEGHLHLVAPGVEWVRRHYSRKIDGQEAVSDGYVGLCDAARRYDASVSNFPTYAPWRIRGEIIDGHRRTLKLGGEHRRQPRIVSHTVGNARSLDAPVSSRASADFTLLHILPDPGVNVEEAALTATLTYRFYEALRSRGATPEELSIIGLKAQGYTHREVATELGISLHRIQTLWPLLQRGIRSVIKSDHFTDTEQVD